MQDESQLHWGGHINLPEGEEVAPEPAELEPLTGVPKLQTSLDLSGEGEERQLVLLVSEGDERCLQLALVDGPGHNPVHQAPQQLVTDQEVAEQQTNSHDVVTDPEVGGDGRPQRQNVVSSQSPTQQVTNGVGSPPAVDPVATDPVSPSSLDKEVLPNNPESAKVVADDGARAGSHARAGTHARADARAGEKPTEKETVVKPSKKVAVVQRKTQRKKVTFDLPNQTSTQTLRSQSKTPTPVDTPVTKKHKPTPKPVGVPIPAQNRWECQNRLSNRWECQHPSLGRLKHH
jgi:hypothetical protein